MHLKRFFKDLNRKELFTIKFCLGEFFFIAFVKLCVTVAMSHRNIIFYNFLRVHFLVNSLTQLPTKLVIKREISMILSVKIYFENDTYLRNIFIIIIFLITT